MDCYVAARDFQVGRQGVACQAAALTAVAAEPAAQ
jgi:hypothetical protein